MDYKIPHIPNTVMFVSTETLPNRIRYNNVDYYCHVQSDGERHTVSYIAKGGVRLLPENSRVLTSKQDVVKFRELLEENRFI